MSASLGMFRSRRVLPFHKDEPSAKSVKCGKQVSILSVNPFIRDLLLRKELLTRVHKSSRLSSNIRTRPFSLLFRFFLFDTPTPRYQAFVSSVTEAP